MTSEDIEIWSKEKAHDARVWVGKDISLADVKKAVRELLDKAKQLNEYCNACLEERTP